MFSEMALRLSITKNPVNYEIEKKMALGKNTENGPKINKIAKILTPRSSKKWHL